MKEMADAGVKILAPPIYMLLALNEKNEIVPSAYAKAAKAAGLDLIAWSLERDGPLDKGGGFYHRSIKAAIDRDGDTLTVLDVLAQAGRRARRVLGLAGDDDVLCELHGAGVAAPARNSPLRGTREAGRSELHAHQLRVTQ